MTLKHISGLEGSLEVTRNGTKPATCRLVCPSRCLAVYRLTHAKSYVWINIKVSSDVDLDPVSRCDFIFDWPSLSFRGHRSFWHKLDSSAVTMTATVTIYRTHRKSHTFSVQWRHPPFLDDLGARFKVKPADDIFPREKLYVVKLAEVCALWVLHSLLTWREVNSRQEKTSTKCCCCWCWRCETTTLYVCMWWCRSGGTLLTVHGSNLNVSVSPRLLVTTNTLTREETVDYEAVSQPDSPTQQSTSLRPCSVDEICFIWDGQL